jgi:membrane fusion protein (multidrug efflux system)
MLAIGVGLVLLAVWAAWFAFGRVTVYQVSRAAHIEVTSASREISTMQGGRLIASGLFIGRQVKAGEVLAELESEPEKLRLAEAEARLAGYPARIGALRRAQDLAQVAQAGTQSANSAELAAARSRTREAQASAEFNRSLAARQQADSDSGGSSQIETERAQSEARRAAAAQEASRHNEARIAGDSTSRGADRAADSARITASIASEESGRAAAEQQVAQLRYELEQRKIRAPAEGVIGDVTSLRLGEVLAAGTRLATIVPDGDLHVVAAFDPATGLGRLTSGQSARLRLDGFSWAQYGDFPARVERVAAEPSGDVLRVELRMPRRRNEDLPLRHGMTGQVNVAIEQVSPAVMLLRAIGQVLA